MFFRFAFKLAVIAAVALLSRGAMAQPQLRYQVDVEGDFAVIGNTIAQDCANGIPAPVVGTVGACGPNVSDSSPDVFWRADDPAPGQATADDTVAVSVAQSTAVLSLPPGAQVIHARLYWSAMSADGSADASVVFERPGVFTSNPTADVSYTLPIAVEGIYESSADVTTLVQTHGNGAYRVGGVDSIVLANVSENRAHVAWTLIVLYELTGEPLRQLTIFDGLEEANSGSGVIINISGFLVPLAGIDAKLGIVAYQSDGQTGGDTLTFNGTDLSDGLGGTNNFFNGSRTFLGAPVSNVGDLPQLTGGEKSYAAVDIDVVDVTAEVAPGSTTASAVMKAGGDNNLLMGALVTSITTFKPDFNDSTKTATDLDGGSLLAGDTLRYTIDVTNTGNDPAIDVVLEDLLPAGVTFVPGSIRVASGANAGPKTDVTGDDQGEYDAASRTVLVRLGTGADASQGGTMAIDEVSRVEFDVTIDAGVTGLVSNQATIDAAGQNGAPNTTYTSTDPTNPGPTDVVVDECGMDSDCPAARPFCLLSLLPTVPNECVECLDDANCSGTTPVCDVNNTCIPCSSDPDCTDPTTPACQTSGALQGACTECSATNQTLCGGNDPECLLAQGICGCSDVDGDSECGAADSGIICNGPAGTCVPGCFHLVPDRNDCPSSEFCSDLTGGRGTCSGQPCLTDGDCSAPTPVCDTVPVQNICVQCLADGDCPSPLICETTGRTCVECTSTNTTNCNAAGTGAICLVNNTCGCAIDADCGSTTSGRVCDGTVEKCTVGCRGTGGNGCPSTQVCTSTDSTIGTCVDCLTDADCGGGTPRCDTAVNTCVECLSNANCPTSDPVCNAGICEPCATDADCTDPTRPACQPSGPLAGTCTECTTSNATLCTGDRPECLDTAPNIGLCGCSNVDGDDECGAADSGRICNGAPNASPTPLCVDGCSTAPSRNDCPLGEFCSDQSGGVGVCAPHCLDNGDCTVAPNLACDTSSIPHTCVECVDDTTCSSPLVCDVSTRVCVGCTSDADCTVDPNRTCDPSTQRCVACLDDGDCVVAPNFTCDTSVPACVECLNDGDCTAPDVCNTTSQTCVECNGDADCAAPDVCDTATNTCVACVDDDDCTDPDVCNTGTQVCVECNADDDCVAPDVCDPTTNMCVPCVDDDDCTDPNVCNTGTQVCVECNADDDCVAPDVCDPATNTCVPCVDDDDCTDPDVCNTGTQVCVECNADDDCVAPDVCDPATNTCVPCVDDDDCTDPDVCDTGTQTCVACVDDDDCTDPDVCDTGTQTCVACVDDDDCTDPDVCNTGTQVCVECTEDADCPDPLVCDPATETCVACVDDDDCTDPDICNTGTQTCVGCVEDTDCMGEMVCDPVVEECVGCTEDADCPDPLVCDTTTQTCHECTPQNTSNCTPEGGGAACLDDNSCGCTEDADCGGTTSGRICDTATSTCTPGCRGEGGNDCPTGEECTSNTMDPGQCVTPEPDAGPADAGAVDSGADAGGDGITQGGGCACRTAGSPSSGSRSLGFIALGLLGIALGRRRRRAS